MFVIDGTGDVDAAVATLAEVVEHEELQGLPLLVLVSKQDLPSAAGLEQVWDKLPAAVTGERAVVIAAVASNQREQIETALADFDKVYTDAAAAAASQQAQ